ncbi:hypothetical protein DL93DRAFT_2086874 [Clavulina sp. PMI_390]|nr:hypothetical protein DL93DRAFT_2086874 [Clavulina sp. PMI_390]
MPPGLGAVLLFTLASVLLRPCHLSRNFNTQSATFQLWANHLLIPPQTKGDPTILLQLVRYIQLTLLGSRRVLTSSLLDCP